jgi:hypothetical protein
MKSITAYREVGLSSKGEFSNENIVFKSLRQFGQLKKLRDGINQLYDKKASLKENKENKTRIWVGTVDNDYNVKAINSSDEVLTHFQVPGYNRNDDRWRWREDSDFIFWWGNPDDEIKQSASIWIKNKTGRIIKKHKSSIDSSDTLKHSMHCPSFKLKTGIKEEKHNPFKDKKLTFVTYGGLSLTKQKGYKGGREEDSTFHQPPSKKGIYAFVWPYIEKFLLGGSEFTDPKSRGKGQRQRTQYVKDKEGNKITNQHPDYKKLTDKEEGSPWSFQRAKKGVDVDADDD